MHSKTPQKTMKKRPLEETSTQRPRKSPFGLVKAEDGLFKETKVFKFRILMPNSTSLELKTTELRTGMPIEEFVDVVKREYFTLVKQQSSQPQRKINWKYPDLHFTDVKAKKIRMKVDFCNLLPNEWNILCLHDGSPVPDTYEGMWDLTPDTDLLKELPDDYTFETALADLIDNSLQALWSNSKGEDKLIINIVVSGKVGAKLEGQNFPKECNETKLPCLYKNFKLMEKYYVPAVVEWHADRISIFDSGPGMDGTNGNLVKWGKMGASLHRSARGQAIGGKPPYLMPFFGMFGYGGPVATMCLGRRAIVSSKTKNCNKVFTLHLEREALMNASRSENCWRTKGGMRDPSEDENRNSHHGSFTKVEIFEPKVNKQDVEHLQCKLKDIYFPYIQFDDTSGKTRRLIDFKVNGEDLAEVFGGEVATTNSHSCNGPDFTVQLHFRISQDPSSVHGQSQGVLLEANARLKCVYFPIVEGKESINTIIDKLKAAKWEIRESFESFSRVAVRRLGRLLPDTRWALLPFMEPKQKKGEKGKVFKRCCSRVKCFIDTDSGFNPTPHKTDLAQHHPYTKALKNFGNRAPENEKEVQIEITRDGNKLTLQELEKLYAEWVLDMHDRYDEEVDSGPDEPTIVIVSSKIKNLDTSSGVLRVHKMIWRKGMCWTAGLKIKVLKGACAGVHSQNLFATLEFIILEGLQGDAGGEARLICRPIGLPENRGCHILNVDGNKTIDIRESLALPIRVIDSEKCLQADETEWKNKLHAYCQKLPSAINLLSHMDCQELEIEGGLPNIVDAGDAPPENIVAVIRPKSYISGNSSKSLDQKFIVKDKHEMSLQVKYRADQKVGKEGNHVFSLRLPPSSLKGLHGLYLFPVKMNHPQLFEKAGFYTFSFAVNKLKDVQVVQVRASAEVGSWKVVNHIADELYTIKVGSCFEPLSVACYDRFDNLIVFTSVPKLTIKLSSSSTVLAQVCNMKVDLAADKSNMKIKDIVVKSSKLDDIRPDYEATLYISTLDEAFSVAFPCQVLPGIPRTITVHPRQVNKSLVPGQIIVKLMLEVYDEYGNHAREDEKILLIVDGFSFQDGTQVVDDKSTNCYKKVNANGFVDLSNLLKVSKGYGKDVSLSVISEKKVILKLNFQTEKRKLRSVLKVIKNCEAGSELENVVFEIVNSDGKVDESIHHEEKHGQSHTLTIKSNSISFDIDDTVRYSFRRGRCTIRSIPLPHTEGIYSFSASHSRYPELNLDIEVHVKKALEDNREFTLNHEDLGNPVPSPRIPCESLQIPPCLPLSKNLQTGHKNVSPLISNEENHQFQMNHDDAGNPVPSTIIPCGSLQIPPRSPLLKNLRTGHKNVSPIITNEENCQFAVNHDDVGNPVSSPGISCTSLQILPHSPLLMDLRTGHKSLSPLISDEKNRQFTVNHDDVWNPVPSPEISCRSLHIPPHSPLLKDLRTGHKDVSPLISNDYASPVSYSQPSLKSPKVEGTNAQNKNSHILPVQVSASQNVENLKEIEDDLALWGSKMIDHQRKLVLLKNSQSRIQQQVSDLQASLARNNPTVPSMFGDEWTVEQIKSKIQSAAAVVCKMLEEAPVGSKPRDILGVVALLGTTQCIEISSILAQYLGEDLMLAIVCENYSAAHEFEINTRHKLANEPISGGYLALCLDDIRFCSIIQLHIVVDLWLLGCLAGITETIIGPQNLLPLQPPTLPGGDVPQGFMGYAVNLISIETSYLQWRMKSGHGLREILFYRLFGELQVYRDRDSMMMAKSCIKDGAVSLDGGILKGNGLVSFGRWEPAIIFPVKNMTVTPQSSQTQQMLEAKKLELMEINQQLDKETEYSEIDNEKFVKSLNRYNNSLLSSSEWTLS
ncbi:hypothetical protein OROHE_021853 [Orobanche hederae]